MFAETCFIHLRLAGEAKYFGKQLPKRDMWSEICAQCVSINISGMSLNEIFFVKIQLRRTLVCILRRNCIPL